ncbi:hypothetical protein GmHk_02G005090 [Glycine max]|nr:hypothetical protein GmHk_02G005090 [Glycine max]
MACTKLSREMAFEVAQQISDNIDILTTVIGRPKHPSCVCVVGVVVTINQYFGRSHGSQTSSLLNLQQLAQLTENIKKKLKDDLELEEKHKEESWRRDIRRRIVREVEEKIRHTPPLEVNVPFIGVRVSTEGSCAANPSREEPGSDMLDQHELYIDKHAPCLVAIGRDYEGVSTIHHMHLTEDMVRVEVEEVRDTDAPVPIPTEKAPKTFLTWLRCLVKPISREDTYGTKKSVQHVDRVDPDDDFFYKLLMASMEMCKNDFEVSWGNSWLNIVVIQLWIMFLNNKSMKLGHGFVYGFLESQCIQSNGNTQQQYANYIKRWMQESQNDIYLGAYLNDALQCRQHWQLVVICPKDNVVVFFCSLHKKVHTKFKALVNRVLKELYGNYSSSSMKTNWIVVKTKVSFKSNKRGRDVEAKLHGESKVIQRSFDDNNDDDKGDEKKLKDQSKNNSSESRTIQEIKIRIKKNSRTQEESLETRIKIQGSRSQESRSRFKTQDSRMKKRLNQDKY